MMVLVALTVAEWWCALEVRRWARSLTEENDVRLSDKKDDDDGIGRHSRSSSTVSAV